MMLSFFISILLIFGSADVNADSALEEVLNIDELKSYFTKTPRFTTTEAKSIVLFNSGNITVNGSVEINKRSIQIINITKIEEKEFIVFIKLNQLRIDKNNAAINLTIQNAILLLEDKQQVQVVAELTKDGNTWEFKNYQLKRVSISD